MHGETEPRTLSLALSTTGIDPNVDVVLIVGVFNPETEETFEFFPKFDPELADYIAHSMDLTELDAKFRGKLYRQYPYTLEEIMTRHGADHPLQDVLDDSGAVLLHGPWAAEFLRKRNIRLPEQVKFLRDALEGVHPDLVFARWEELAEICNIPLTGINLGFPIERAKLQWQIYQTLQRYKEKSEMSPLLTQQTLNTDSRNIDQSTF